MNDSFSSHEPQKNWQKNCELAERKKFLVSVSKKKKNIENIETNLDSPKSNLSNGLVFFLLFEFEYAKICNIIPCSSQFDSFIDIRSRCWLISLLPANNFGSNKNKNPYPIQVWRVCGYVILQHDMNSFFFAFVCQ